LALDGGEWWASHLDLFPPEVKALGTHWIGGWMDSKAGLDAVGKRKISYPRRESNTDSSAVNPLAYSYYQNTRRHIVEYSTPQNITIFSSLKLA
jgi:hypothetical protein